MRGLCRRADLILPNATEAALLLEREPQTDAFDDASAQPMYLPSARPVTTALGASVSSSSASA